jgi:DNA processing protein
MLAIVGTRKATSYGMAAVASLLEGFSEYQGLVVVSGLAYGIDIAAHRKCLELGIPTVAVQANGLGSVYPPQHEPVAQQMLRQGGGMLSEYPFHDKPEAHRFPSRNRIIAGLCDAVVVVEARAKGGALITALLANSYSREVCAIPGDIRRDTSEGCHNLIKRNQAHLATCAADVAYLMDWKPGEAQQAGGQQLSLHLEDPLEKRVCQLLRQGDQHLDLLSLQTDIPLNQLAGLLLQLEFRGIVKALPGKVFALARKIG